jgi:MFS family permease
MPGEATIIDIGHQSRPVRAGLVAAADVRFATWIAFLAWVFAVYDFILFGTLLPVLGTANGWSAAKQAALATWISAGTAVVALLVGPVVDRLGRRAGITFTVGGAAVCSALTALGGAFGQVVLVLIRSVSGLGYAEQSVNATYLSELYAVADDPRLAARRGFVYSLVQGGWPIGALLAAALTAILLPLIGWRGCFVFAAVPSLVIAVLARRLVETPQFEAQRARQGAAEHTGTGAGIAAAFRGAPRRATLAIGGAFLLNWFAIQVFSVLGTTVITSVHHVSFNSSLLILILSNLVGYVGYLTHGLLGDRFGRRNVIALGWVIGGLAFTAMLYGPDSLAVVVALYSIGLFFLIGPYAALLFFIGESYPTAIRGTGGTIIAATGPVGAIIASFGATALLAGGGDWQTAAFWFGAIPCFVSGFLMLLARPVDPRADVQP